MNANRRQLETYIDSGKLVRLTRPHPSARSISGFVLGVSDELCLLHVFYDCVPDGYVVIRTKNITDIRSGACERFSERVMRGENLLQGVKHMPEIKLDGMRSCVESIHRTFGRMIVEVEDDEEAIQDFYVGRVLKLGEKGFQFQHFDAEGRWEDDASEITYAEITKLQFEVHYLRAIWAYVV